MKIVKRGIYDITYKKELIFTSFHFFSSKLFTKYFFENACNIQQQNLQQYPQPQQHHQQQQQHHMEEEVPFKTETQTLLQESEGEEITEHSFRAKLYFLNEQM
ncbi:hypothetical protein Glove_33g135 [Diversispora epigaea]|uniref:Uncharacterized protein n=1 Tax=Diversispora epigaea TaxID=1348612 RepID=A0A397JRP0_9GLOM|nr:hypothetical protein Glove_33g135 [Diversispora epigaea]